MEENLSLAGGIITSIILLFAGILIVPLSIGMLLSFPDIMFYAGILLFVSATVLISGGITGLRKLVKQRKQAEEVLEQIQINPSKEYLTDQKEVPGLLEQPLLHEDFQPNQVLARWMVSQHEWDLFYKVEKKKRLESMWIESIIVLLLGALLIKWSRNTSWDLALFFSGGVALVWWVLKYFLHLNVLKSQRLMNELILTTSSVAINGKLHVFYDSIKTPGKILLHDMYVPAVIEITYYWKTRKGSTFEELRIPVPVGKEAEARQIVSKLSSFL